MRNMARMLTTGKDPSSCEGSEWFTKSKSYYLIGKSQRSLSGL